MKKNNAKGFRERFHVPGKLALSLDKLLGREILGDDHNHNTDDNDNSKQSRFRRLRQFAKSLSDLPEVRSNTVNSLA
ncbi:MAG: hypothetical protein WAQ98_16190 [Blastocatellia bacterium]